MSNITLTISQTSILNSKLQQIVRIVAGPGSGKTQVLKSIYQKLLKKNKPEKILVLAFNVDAIKSFKMRMQKAAIQYTNQLQIKTIHAFWLQILKKYMRKKMNKKVVIVDEKDFKDIELIIKRDKIEQKVYLNQQYTLKYCRFGQILDLCMKYYIDHEQQFTQFLPQYQYILIDQFQDVDKITLHIISSYYGQKKCALYVVGDEDQSIYGFTHKIYPNNFLQIQKYFNNIQTFKLQENKRSSKNIVHLSNELISYNKNRITKSLYSQQQRNAILLLRKYQTEQDEAKSIVKKIKILISKYKVKYSNIAILCRWNKQFIVIKQQLTKKKVPYFTDEGEISNLQKQKQMIKLFLRLILRKQDFVAKDRLCLFLQKNIIKTLEYFLKQQRQLINQNKVVIQKIIKDIIVFLKSDNQSKLINYYTKIIEQLAGYTFGIKVAIKYILSYQNPSANYNFIDKIQLYTCHRSKGLQFDYVFIIGLNKKNYGNNKNEIIMQEQRRILYVGMTRAKKRLFLSYDGQMCEWLRWIGQLDRKIISVESKLNKNVRRNKKQKKSIEKYDVIRKKVKMN